MTLNRTKALAASLSKYTLYTIRLNISVCNLMFAIKNYAVSENAQFTESMPLNQDFPAVTDLCLPEEFTIPNHSLRSPHVGFTPNHTLYLQLLTNYQEPMVVGKAIEISV